jgi:hypothetical protein
MRVRYWDEWRNRWRWRIIRKRRTCRWVRGWR